MVTSAEPMHADRRGWCSPASVGSSGERWSPKWSGLNERLKQQPSHGPGATDLDLLVAGMSGELGWQSGHPSPEAVALGPLSASAKGGGAKYVK